MVVNDNETDMNSMKFIGAVTAASLAFGSAAFAQGNDANTEHGVAQRDSRPETNADRGQPQERAQQQRERRSQQVVQHEERGAGPSHNFRRGGRLPSEYRDRRYVVDDWRGHHLRQPPRGYQWVQTGDDFVLAAIATGVIASVLLSSH